jgi:hypothetical protein
MNATFVSGFRTGYHNAGGTSLQLKESVKKIAHKQLWAVTNCFVLSGVLYWLLHQFSSEPLSYHLILAISIGLMMETGGYNVTQSWIVKAGMLFGATMSVLTTGVLCLLIVAFVRHLFG